MTNTFLYFAYGSNLLAHRIHLNSPSAVRRNFGQLKNYRLDFITFSNRWKGASATIVPSENDVVWGAIWEIDMKERELLDQQEGVHNNIYFAFETDIELSDGAKLKCRVYQQCITPEKISGEVPEERRPSLTYLNTIIKGAAESDLPEYYQKYLQTIPHNGFGGSVNLDLNLKE